MFATLHELWEEHNALKEESRIRGGFEADPDAPSGGHELLRLAGMGLDPAGEELLGEEIESGVMRGWSRFRLGSDPFALHRTEPDPHGRSGFGGPRKPRDSEKHRH